MKIFTAPQHTRFILPPIHPTKFFACLAGRFFFYGTGTANLSISHDKEATRSMSYRDNLFLNARFKEAVQAAHDQDWQAFEKYSFYDARMMEDLLYKCEHLMPLEIKCRYALPTLLQSWRSFSHHSEVRPPSQDHSPWQLARCSAGERKKSRHIHHISWRHRQHWACTAFYFMVTLLRCCWMVCAPQRTLLSLPLPCVSGNDPCRQGNCVSSWAQWIWNHPASECQRCAGNHAAERIQSSV